MATQTNSAPISGIGASLVVEEKPVSTLKPYRANARTHTKHQIRQIANSIVAFGFTNPILIDGNNCIIAGHGRVEAAMAAERVGRFCCGIEIDPAYVDVAIRRWQEHTGDHAVHAVTAKRFEEVAESRGGLMSSDDPQYEVGYGKPPKVGQFTKGRSGNPRGRPKGSKNLATIVLHEARQPVRVNGPNGTRKVTKLQAAAMQLSTKAAQGDHRASRDFFNLVERSELANNAGAAPQSLPENDRTMMEMVLRRMQEVKPEPAEPGNHQEENSK